MGSPNSGQLDGTLVELRWVWAGHEAFLPRDDIDRLRHVARQTGGSSVGRVLIVCWGPPEVDFA